MTSAECVVVTGAAAVCPAPDDDFGAVVDPLPYLRVRKSRKYLAPQDDLATVAAGRALASAHLSPSALGARAGLAICVGFLSFDERDVDPVLRISVDSDGAFDMRRFISEGMRKTHPLLTFRCLPNMPAYHISANFDLRGPYLATYPGVAQSYDALERAMDLLLRSDSSVDVMLVAAVAHQRNFLVGKHFARIEDGPTMELLRDAAAVVVLERSSSAHARGQRVLARLTELSRAYEPFDPTEAPPPAHRELFCGQLRAEDRGCASLLCALSEHLTSGQSTAFVHEANTRDGHTLTSRWEVRP
ncbi:MAG: beta-ketoacyl synthase N-terminal-like domain-containing protein [Deltaproteobacteria bacterium]|nr:beta-ketoacyl synthase N-terminal-like domain-containing protein [Deltaproteobacteria bacterium]